VFARLVMLVYIDCVWKKAKAVFQVKNRDLQAITTVEQFERAIHKTNNIYNDIVYAYKRFRKLLSWVDEFS